MRVWLGVLVLVGTVATVKCVGVDMGQCSCLCGSDTETSILSQGSNMPATSYYDRLRGPAGISGRPGKIGPQGIAGAVGPKGPRGPPGKSMGEHGSFLSPSSSCFDLLTKGTTASGIYTIKPENYNDPMQVYCDLQSAGGGWTLVASIHENNIDGKCTIGDKWSSEQGTTSQKHGESSSSWQNFEVFGNPLSATSADYKSPAYFTLEATDVMLWHVQNDVSILEAMDQATLRYYTDSKFLTKYGGNLRLMFDKYLPMKKTDNWNTNTRGLEGLIAALNNSAAAIRNCVPGFYNYVYDFDGTTQNYIKDGGQDMFDTGNKVFYKIGTHPPIRITYNEHYKNTSQAVEVMSSTEHPFETLMWIGNNDRTISTFSLRVESGTGADGDGSHNTLTGTLPPMGNLTAKYIAYVISGASDPSICEVFYYIANAGGWGSVEPTAFTQAQWATTTDNVNLEVQFEGRPSSILAGYTLLSRRDPIAVTEEQVRAVITEIMRTLSTFGKLDEYNCGRLNESVVEPVTYLTGDDSTVMAGIPPLQTSSATPGFVQFRSLSPTGEPNAICPGVKSEGCRPQSYCVGGINTMKTNPKTCGDFAGWDGDEDDEPTDTVGAGSAKPLNDLKSTILLFTRNEPSN